MDIKTAKRTLPEYKEVLSRMGGAKPRKFVEAITIIPCPATFNPSSQGDYAFTHSYAYRVSDGEFVEGPGYTYESMMVSGVNPYEREVDMPRGMRMWVVTYDGMWGGYWSKVNVYVHSAEMLSGAEIEEVISEIEPELTNVEWAVLSITQGLISSARAEECRGYSINYHRNRESLIEKGLLNQNGAINRRGKGALESKFGYKSHYEILRELGYRLF